MRISGNAIVNAPGEEIWALIFNPKSLLQLVPGCDQVEQVAPDQYRARLTLRVPALAGSYEIRIRIMESEPLCFCRLEGDAQGPGGGVKGTGIFTLLPQDQQTCIEYDSEIRISGPLAGMHVRFIEGVAQTLMKQGLAKLAELTQKPEELKP